MKCFTFSKTLFEGLVLSVDEKLGQVVFLGQSGPKGARYEKVRLDRQSPAAVVGGKVIEAEPKKITLPARDGKPEKIFYTLAKPSGQKTDAVLVRICTQGVYTRGTYGSWRVIEGNPEGLISGIGADTESTKNYSWSDGLVLVRPGDVIKITLSGGSKFDPYALYFDAAEKLTVVDFAQWQAGQAALEVQKDPDGAEVLFGTMPAYSFSKAGFAAGIEPTVSAGGSVLTLGREGRYSKTVTIAVANDLPMEIEEVAVAKTGESLVLVNGKLGSVRVSGIEACLDAGQHAGFLGFFGFEVTLRNNKTCTANGCTKHHGDNCTKDCGNLPAATGFPQATASKRNYVSLLGVTSGCSGQLRNEFLDSIIFVDGRLKQADVRLLLNCSKAAGASQSALSADIGRAQEWK